MSLKYSAIVMPVNIEASLAATGMLDVLTTMTVRRLNGRPDVGSLRSGKSDNISDISLPRSPQPTYTTMSLLENLAMLCSTTVLPVPKPPGTMAVPPSATGRSVSKTLWPVMNGTEGGSFVLKGLGTRTGHSWKRPMGLPVESVQTESSPETLPDLISVIVPDEPGGTIILWTT